MVLDRPDDEDGLALVAGAGAAAVDAALAVGALVVALDDRELVSW